MLIVLWILGAYVAILLLIAWLSLHPIRLPQFLSPGSLGLPQESVAYKTEDGVAISAWWVEGNNPAKCAVLVHGYLMNRCELVPVAHHLWQQGYSCLIPDLRCHGKSGGRKCGLGYSERMDVIAACQFARGRKPVAAIVVVGSSMGAAAASFAVAQGATCDILVLDSGFGKLASAVSGWWRFVGGRWLSFVLTPSVLIAAPLLGRNPFSIDAAQALAKVEVPTLILHGDQDTLALPAEAERNRNALKGPVQIVWFENCGHSEGRWESSELYYSALDEFLGVHLETAAKSATMSGG